ncbi:MAG: hypothetical protein ABIP78_12505 [Pyrinomonadaceae bacterium]
MELEFDKEIDAILRKARSGIGATVGTDAGHVDADSIAAFAENALPDKSRLLYVEHFADCDKCRKQLSQTILMNNEAVTSLDATASKVSAPDVEAAIPWYQTLLRTPNLALAMGALLVAFSSILGYLVLQNKNETANSDVSQVTDSQPRSGPYYSGESGAAMSNANATAADSAMSPANKAANSSPGSSNSAAKAPADVTGRIDSASNSGADPTSGSRADDKDKTGNDNEKSAAAPPPSGTMDGVAAERNEKKPDAENKKESQTDSTLAKRKQSEERGSRDMPAAASKSGPSRAGPMQNQSNQVNNNIADMPVTRLVGGKRLENRNGAWYDSAYRGQATINVRRSSDEYKKIDKGIRNIADTLGGTVVVVWKEKAYRVQ